MPTIWAISDLHLNLAACEPRPSDAPRWRGHVARIEEAWREAVRPSDLVLIPGDISLAGNHRDVQPDLAWLASLPGKKVLSPGNHDRWWGRVERVRPLLRRSMFAVAGDAICVDGVVICGARGAPADDSSQSRYQAELQSLDRALAHASILRASREPLYVLWHFPPFDKFGQPGAVVERLTASGVTACVYGHIHQMGQWATAVQGEHGGVLYACVAADAIGFRPLRIDGS